MTDKKKKITEISLELLEMLTRMFTSRKRSETFYLDKISVKINKIIDSRLKELEP